MKPSPSASFDEQRVLNELKHFLPAQAPLKDFIHHNTLHAFQHEPFHEAVKKASVVFGYSVFLPLSEYRNLYATGRIRKEILEKLIIERKGEENRNVWLKKIVHASFTQQESPRIGRLRANWKTRYHIDIDTQVHPIFLRILCNYLDQGISIWNFPTTQKSFLDSLRELEQNSFVSIFRTKKARELLFNKKCNLKDLLQIIVGDESLFEQYLFDQQFTHQGWSGMVATIESQPESLIDRKPISLQELIHFELLLEIDTLQAELGPDWAPLVKKMNSIPEALFAETTASDLQEILAIWQDAFEWSYYDHVLAGIQLHKHSDTVEKEKTFQAVFCIDDRECSLRRYLEKLDPLSETYSTPGFFGVEFFYQPDHGKHYTKLCPAPVTPKYLIKESGTKKKKRKGIYLTKRTHTLLRGWLSSQTIGFWSAFNLLFDIFKPSESPFATSSFGHMDPFSNLTIENKNKTHIENGLQVGFTVEEMATRVHAVLKSMGLVSNFAPLVYVIGHGASSVNNPHYAAYDCGACCGRPGSVNARVFCFMANHPGVRKLLVEMGIHIPARTQFLGGLHDTTRDEIAFYDERILSKENISLHKKNEHVFLKALDFNAKERSRRFESIDTSLDSETIHEKVRRRSVSLFEPRPELNHATNALCIVGRRDLTKNLFLDRRSFMNSYDYRLDPDGKFLFNILKAAVPVCGGINLEYFFSRVDNQKLGAGTKLPHNVMGLIGVANGVDGDLRPGLPSQMIEVHDPVRLLMIVEHFPQVVMEVFKLSAEMYEWIVNDWVYFVVIHPETKQMYLFKNGRFTIYEPLEKHVEYASDLTSTIETNDQNIPVHIINA